MRSTQRFPADPAFSQAWRLFRALHDAPSLECAEKLVLWLGRDAKHVRALDDALTLWALAGAAIAGPASGERDGEGDGEGGSDERTPTLQ